ncbi:hypothetical protein HHK36_016288 [Tetracentron sinense]|uniref:Glucuronosyltransferase n=1 Tax=Tetracentron sinense TaxID=13715 RepID=A0A834Z0H3_TETSI|nr:hypothetical protein HHK36_016288 [Tetracentron sinense]
MLKLAELLSQAGFHITFLNTYQNRRLQFTDVHSRLTRSPGFRFYTISDGFLPDHPRSAELVRDLFVSFKSFGFQSLSSVLSLLAAYGLIAVFQNSLKLGIFHLKVTTTWMETLLRRRDLPSFCRIKDLEHPVLKFFVNEALNIARASRLILNTFDDLQGPMLSHLGSHFPKLYTIGPVHTILIRIIR